MKEENCNYLDGDDWRVKYDPITSRLIYPYEKDYKDNKNAKFAYEFLAEEKAKEKAEKAKK